MVSHKGDYYTLSTVATGEGLDEWSANDVQPGDAGNRREAAATSATARATTSPESIRSFELRGSKAFTVLEPPSGRRSACSQAIEHLSSFTEHETLKSSWLLRSAMFLREVKLS